jgi:hypothetical protein
MKQILSPALTRAYRRLAWWARKTRELQEAEARRKVGKGVRDGR